VDIALALAENDPAVGSLRFSGSLIGSGLDAEKGQNSTPIFSSASWTNRGPNWALDNRHQNKGLAEHAKLI
jgi:hypothetical protein